MNYIPQSPYYRIQPYVFIITSEFSTTHLYNVKFLLKELPVAFLLWQVKSVMEFSQVLFKNIHLVFISEGHLPGVVVMVDGSFFFQYFEHVIPFFFSWTEKLVLRNLFIVLSGGSLVCNFFL